MTTLQSPPKPPEPPKSLTLEPAAPKKEQVDAYEQQVNAYIQQVSAYAQQVSAYKVYTEASAKSGRTEAYRLVVKETLVPLLGTVFTALVTYVFVSAGATLADNFIRFKNGQPLRERLW